MKKHSILGIAFLFGLGLILMLWPENERLSVLHKVKPFSLSAITEETYQADNGKAKVVTFFYTNCPDVCPMTMNDMRKVQKMLREESLLGKKVELLSITIDPEFDTLEIIEEYAASFQADPAGWKWLRGTEQQTKEITKAFRMNTKKLEGGLMAHSTTIYLLDKENNIRALYEMANVKNSVDVDEIMNDIMYLLDK